MQNKCGFGFYEEGFKLPVPSWCWKMIANINISYISHNFSMTSVNFTADISELTSSDGAESEPVGALQYLHHEPSSSASCQVLDPLLKTRRWKHSGSGKMTPLCRRQFQKRFVEWKYSWLKFYWSVFLSEGPIDNTSNFKCVIFLCLEVITLMSISSVIACGWMAQDPTDEHWFS